MNVLICCEFSGAVRRAFQAKGHNAWSCDLLPSEDGGLHIQGDAIEAVWAGAPNGPSWDLIIAHPPCTYLANSGARWLYVRGTRDRVEQRWQDMAAGARFFANLWNACGNIPRCFENPIMHGYAKQTILNMATIPRPQIIQPCDFGHMEKKATGLYLFRLPPLKPTKIVRNEMALLSKAERSRVHYASPGPNRWKERSRTLLGIAEAMAVQWSNI